VVVGLRQVFFGLLVELIICGPFNFIIFEVMKKQCRWIKGCVMQINLVRSKAQTKVIFVNNNNFHTKIFYGPIQELNHFHGTKCHNYTRSPYAYAPKVNRSEFMDNKEWENVGMIIWS
jgi:hypothetical protein